MQGISCIAVALASLLLVGAQALAAETRLAAVPFTEVKIQDQFWAPRIETNRAKTIRHDFEMCEKTGRIDNFSKAAGQMPGEFRGIFYDDSDVYKVIEGAAYSLAQQPDPELDHYLDGLIAKIAAAQQKDGYLSTYFILKEQGRLPEKMQKEDPDTRWSNLKDKHELYCAGHLIEAAVAHNRATGKKSLLNVATKLADHIDSIFGPDKRHGTSGHEEIELALVKLSNLTGEKRYFNLAKYFLDERGKTTHELYGKYHQDHMPVTEQSEPVGHAVRAVYLYSGMADVAAGTGEQSYVDALDRIWDHLIVKRMYITGGIGARHEGEAFGDDYELPNDTAYAETCAAVGNCLWNHRMNLLHADAKYADVLERVLYNGFLSGVSLQGDKFFYVNPLSSKGNHHRQEWFSTACCPVNVVRFLPSLGGYIYARTDDAIYVNLYVAGRGIAPLKDNKITLVQETRYPWEGAVKLTVNPEREGAFDLNLRIPAWSQGATINVNGQPIEKPVIDKGYAHLHRTWKAGDLVSLDLPMPVQRVHTDPQVKADAGRVALQRGPVVYCAEAADNGPSVSDLVLPRTAPLSAEFRPDLLGGVTVIQGKTQSVDLNAKDQDFLAIPYYAWDHRAPGAMAVWLQEGALLPDAAP